MEILNCIQAKIHRSWLTPIMSFFSHPPYWRHLMLLIVLTALILGSNRVRWQIGYLLLATLCSEHTCNLIKELVKRVRPDGDRPTGNFWEKLGHYSFPSSHAANMFCAAVFTIHYWSYIGIFLFGWAVLVTFSRVYLRNHYPSDVLAGGLIGAAYGILFVYLGL